METSKAVLLGSAMIALSVLIAGGTFSKLGIQGYQQQAAAPAAAGAPTAPTGPLAEVTVGNLPIKGDENAKVTIVEFADYQCPFCGAVTGLNPDNPVYKQMVQQDPTWQAYEQGILKDYVATGKAKFAYRDFAFLGQESTDAANAARCANEQGKFWEYHDKVYFSQSGENEGAFAKDKLKKYGADLGLNTAKFNECVDQGKYNKDVEADTAAGRASGVSGTPAVFINGKMISGAVPYSTVKAEIEAALAK